MESLNHHLVDTGRPEINERDTLFHAYAIIESEEFKKAKPEERIRIFKEKEDIKPGFGETIPSEDIMRKAVDYIASRYLASPTTQFRIESKHPEVEENIQRIWEEEACEKSIFPYLEELAGQK